MEPKTDQKFIPIENMISKLKSKGKEIQTYLRKMAEIELRKQILNNTVGYSQLAMSNLAVPEAQIKAYLNGSSQKILQ